MSNRLSETGQFNQAATAARRYPDLGSGRAAEVQAIFTLSEGRNISAKEPFMLAARVAGFARTVANEV